MKQSIGQLEHIQPDLDFDHLIDLSEADEADTSSVIVNASSGGTAARAGSQTNSLQTAMDNYACAMNRSAIAKSTGLPVRTPSQQYKGFIAEEYFKHTLKINALAKGVPDWKIGVYTDGTLPDGSVLSGIDEHVDISVWTRKHPWSKPMRTVDYQSKILNDASKYEKVFNDPKYQSVKHVGGSGQGVNDTVKVAVGKKTIQSDSITPAAAVEKADQAKAQSTPEYDKRQEKLNELNRVNIGRAVAAGAATGFLVSTVQEIIQVIKNSKDLSEDQFVKSIKHILCGSVEGGIRGGAISGSIVLMGKMLGREVAANSIEAIPGMVIANVAIDFAKDLYKCFVSKTIDTDDLLCNSVNNVFSSAAGFSGAWMAGQLAGHIAGQFSGQAFAQSISIFASMKASAATGAAIGSSLGPIGTVIGSALGGIVIGIGANAIIGIANKDAIKAYTECINEINSHIELNGCARFARNTVDSLTTVRELKERGIEVYFEKENIWTLDSKGELLITIMSSLAQEESRSISENTTWGIRKRFADGKASVAYSTFLGYDQGFEIIEEEAETVRLIYDLFLDGLGYHAIARELERLGRKTATGRDKWHAASIISILTNEKYAGHALMQKQFTLDFLTKKKKKNEGEVVQQYVDQHHDAIIPDITFQHVQEEVKRRREIRAHTKDNPFSSKVKCECCGGWYGARTWHSNDKYRRTMYLCNNKYKVEGHPKTPSLSEQDLQQFFLKAIGQLFRHRDSFISDMNTLITMIDNTSSKENEVLSAGDAAKQILAEYQRVIQNSGYAITDTQTLEKQKNDLIAKYNAEIERANKAKEEIEQAHAKVAALRSLIEQIEKAPHEVLEFDRRLWARTVDYMTIKADGSVIVTLYGGTEIEVKE